MTIPRVLLGVVGAFVAIVALAVVMAVCAEAWGRPEAAVALRHSASMFALTFGLCAASGLVIWLAWALKNDVRTARVLGSATSKTLHGHHAMGSASVRQQRE